MILYARTIGLFLFMFSSIILLSQHDLGKYKLVNIYDPVIPLITNRKIDTLQHDWKVLRNEIDHSKSLKVFIADIFII